jgi:hypothetical protein
MWHPDEGLLHAYLDGEVGADGAERQGGRAADEIERHLASCDLCQALLAEVRLTRERASAILAHSGPTDLTMPPFEEIRARSTAQSATRRRILQLNRVRQLAWAATVVLAVAVGWYARDRLRPDAAERIGRSAAAPSSVPVAQPEAEADAAARFEVAERELQEAQDQLATGRGAEASEAPREAVLAQDRSKAEGVEEETVPLAVAADRVAGARRDAPTQLAAEPVAEAEKRRQNEIRERLADSTVAAYQAAAPVAPQRVAVDNVANRAALARPSAAQEFFYRTVAESEWSLSNEAAATEYLGVSVAKVEDLPVLDYAIHEADGRRIVRVRQRLDAATVLELIQLREVAVSGLVDAREAALDEARRVQEMPAVDSLNAVVAQRGDLRIVLRAPVALEELRELVERIR